MFPWVLFAVLSLPIIAISWKSLGYPRSHGFYRFFAWEAILVLFLRNARWWFYRPLAWNQILAWLLLLLSLLPLIFGIRALRAQGQPAKRREGDPSLLAFEKTTALVTRGVYKYIRHPLYSSLLLLAWGIFFKSPTLAAAVLAILATFFLIATAKADEAECINFFGAPYREYRKKTKMFVPFLFHL